ncbi:unnamed protein product [Symbiodinium sp. CCMP2456]|nr:unnamed protein product [Symbiodinium sp. CCMP2456]
MIVHELAKRKTSTPSEAPAELWRPGPNLAEANLGECDICKKVMEAVRDVKTLPCRHRFHFDCIDGFHRRKLREQGDVNLPCFTCGAASHKSIAAVVAERHRQKEQAIASPCKQNPKEW